MCVSIFSTNFLSGTFLILRRMERNMNTIYKGFHVKYSLFLSDFNKTWSSKIYKYQI